MRPFQFAKCRKYAISKLNFENFSGGPRPANGGVDLTPRSRGSGSLHFTAILPYLERKLTLNALLILWSGAATAHLVTIIINLFAKVQTMVKHNKQWWRIRQYKLLNCANSCPKTQCNRQ